MDLPIGRRNRPADYLNTSLRYIRHHKYLSCGCLLTIVIAGIIYWWNSKVVSTVTTVTPRHYDDVEEINREISKMFHHEFWDKYYIKYDQRMQKMKKERQHHPAPRVVVHLDLKGAPPKMVFLNELMEQLTSVGVNTLLIEYEDMFPFDGILSDIRNKNAYSKTELMKFLRLCETNGIEVIPLVQTFGHMEYVLKLEKYRRLREVDGSPGEICPTKYLSKNLIKEILSQVLSVHSIVKSTRIHIGCDEVDNINHCEQCVARNAPSKEIFAQHIWSVTEFLRKEHPGVTAIIWDDMLRKWPNDIDTLRIPQYVELMVWDYTRNPEKSVHPSTWHSYFTYFDRIWLAGAFKGATTPTEIVPDIESHYYNQIGWLNFFVKKFPTDTILMGYVLTGWSRYDHFAALCELLPVAIPSLSLNAVVVTSGLGRKLEIRQSYFDSIECHRVVHERASKITIESKQLMEHCFFRGKELFMSMLELKKHRNDINRVYVDLYENGGWMSRYHIETNFTNGYKIIKQFDVAQFLSLRSKFNTFRFDLREHMKYYYNNATINEWFKQHIDVYTDKLEFLYEGYRNALKFMIWNRRES